MVGILSTYTKMSRGGFVRGDFVLHSPDQGLSCLRMKSRDEISDHTQVELVQYARAADSKMFLSLKTKRIQIRRLS